MPFSCYFTLSVLMYVTTGHAQFVRSGRIMQEAHHGVAYKDT